MTPCTYCHEPVAPDAAKCPHCGEALVERPRQAAEDLSEVFGWMFQDPNWVVKLVICTGCLLFSCLLLPMVAAMGYKLRVARQQRRAPGVTPMPEWDDPGALLADGARVFGAMLLLALVLFTAAGLLLGGGAAVDLLTSGRLGPFFAIAGAVAYVGVLAGSLGLQYVLPAIEMELVETGSPLAALRVRALWRRISTRPGDYFLLFIYCFVTNMIGGFLWFLLYAPVAWAMVTQGALIGRYLAQQRAKDAALGLE